MVDCVKDIFDLTLDELKTISREENVRFYRKKDEKGEDEIGFANDCGTLRINRNGEIGYLAYLKIVGKITGSDEEHNLFEIGNASVGVYAEAVTRTFPILGQGDRDRELYERHALDGRTRQDRDDRDSRALRGQLYFETRLSVENYGLLGLCDFRGSANPGGDRVKTLILSLKEFTKNNTLVCQTHLEQRKERAQSVLKKGREVIGSDWVLANKTFTPALPKDVAKEFE